ncbi:MAG: S26 family signal peptidase, partial [Chloroflexi bacterium]
MSVKEKYPGDEYPEGPHPNQNLTDEPSAGEVADSEIEVIDEPAPGKSSPAEPADLNNVMGVQRPQALPVDMPASENTAADDTAEPSYKVSPAEPDFSVYGSDTLETGEMPVIEEEKESGWKITWAIVREVGETVILTLVIFLLIQMVVRNFRVVGTSMINNLHDGQYLIIDKLSYNPWVSDYLGIGGPQRGDVIV